MIVLDVVPSAAERLAVARRSGRWGLAALAAGLIGAGWGAAAGALGAAAGAAVAAWLVWWAPVARIRRDGPAAALRLAFDADGWQLVVGGVTAAGGWPAVRAMEPCPAGWLLDLDGAWVCLPAAALAPGDAGRIAAWRAGGGERVVGEPPAGHGAVRVQFVGTDADYVEAARHAGGGRWAALAAFAVVGAALLSEGVGDVRLLAAWAAAGLAAAALRRELAAAAWRLRAALAGPRWVGPVAVGLGDRGGWVGSAGGDTCFGWAEVDGAAATAAGLVLRVGRSALVVPRRAYPDVDGLAAQVAAWRAAAPPPSGRRAPGPLPGPFTPPRS